MKATRTYLQMTSPDQFAPAPERSPDARVERIPRCAEALFRYFYVEVGRTYHWTDRLSWSDEQIRRHLDDPRISFWVLFVRNEPAGYFELRRDTSESVEIAYFGLLPAFVGRGLGGYLLSVAIEEAWRLLSLPRRSAEGSAGARTRVWLHTSTLDHPAALHNYLARGFVVERCEEYDVDVAARPC